MFTNVMFKGEVYAITGLSSFSVLSPSVGDRPHTVLFKLEAVEMAKPFTFSRCVMVPREAFVWLPSGIDFEESEWSQGVNNGQAK